MPLVKPSSGCQKLTSEAAKIMIDEYRQIDVDSIETLSGGAIKRLDALRIKRSKVDEIFKNKRVTELALIFCVKHPSPDDTQLFSIILAGVEKDQADDTDIGTIAIEPIYEFCDPCPDKCFTNFDEDQHPF